MLNKDALFAEMMENKYDFLQKVNIKKVKVNRDLNSWDIQMEGPFKLERSTLIEMEKSILSTFDFLSDIKIVYDQMDECKNKKYEKLIDWFHEEGDILFRKLKLEFPSIAGSIPLSNWEIKENRLIIKTLSKIALERIKKRKIPEFIKDKISQSILFPLHIEIVHCQNEVSQDHYIDSKEKELISIVNTTINENSKTSYKKNAPNGRSDVLKGKTIRQEAVSISSLSLESGVVVLQGEVFSVDIRLINNNRGIITFYITDHTSSITIKLFERQDCIDSIKEALKENPFVRVKGEVQFDKYSRDLVVIASDIQNIPPMERKDLCESKRVELHVHTQFSAMDGVSKVEKIIAQAAKWGHSAIAITDHGVLQAFPDAMKAGKKNNIKIIYGVEGYLINDEESVIWGDYKANFDQSFVVFDIETTGLSPEKEKITEIGAVKIREGQVIECFSSLVNPACPIPNRISELTGITDDMVKDAPFIEEVLPKFINFIQDSILVAHNAKFDSAFIKNQAALMNIQIINPILDTLALSRMCLPHLKKHRLNDLAKHYNVKLRNHHRALEDAQATAEIFLKLMEYVRSKGAKTLEELNYIFKTRESIKKMETYHIIILVKNLIGLKNLYRLVSESHLEYFYKKPRIPKSLLKKYREGLIIGTACEAGELYKALLRNAEQAELENILLFYDYLEIQPIENNQFLIERGLVESREQLIQINKRIVSLGDQYNKPVVATCDVHFIEDHDEIYRRILMAGQGYQDADRQAPLYFRTTNEMLKEFEYLGQEKCKEVVIQNTNHIADQVEDILPVPNGTFPPQIDGAEDEIYTMTMERAHELYGKELPKIVKERIEKELNSIINNGYAVLYLIAHKLVKKSLEDGYLVGSRGSVGSSLVATLTNITEVNPLPPHYICPKCKNSEFFDSNIVGVGPDLPDAICPKCGTPYKKDGFDIPFEVFLGFEGDKEPDIDLNFSGEYQSIAHKYTEELFGKGQVFRAGTIGTIAEKTAYGFVKNYADDRNRVFHNAEINRLVRGCTGVKRTTGQHPGGIMVVPKDKDIYDFTPIQRPADDEGSDIITTHFDYHSLNGRLLKLDILGHDDPTVIRMLEDLTGIDATKINLDDKATLSLFTSTKALNIEPEDINSKVGTFGIPEFGTKFVRQMLEETKPSAFADLIRISGLSHGTDVWLNNAQELIRKEICSIKEVISTRDDIMVYLIYKGLEPKTAFQIMEKVRKGKGLSQEDQEEMRNKNVPSWYIDSCNKIKYMFPKAHAAAYVMMAFRIAYFKVHYPLAFYATYFTVRADDFDADLISKGKDSILRKIKEIEAKGNNATAKEKSQLTVLETSLEMYCRGYKILPVDLYRSHAKKFIIVDDALLAPLNSLQGLGTKAAYNIVKARNSSKFISKEDLRERSKISKNIVEILDKHGCLKDLPESNQLSLF